MIADVLEQRGELEESLRIRREEELPVYEHMGDVRASAMTLGQIADVLAQQGELEESLRVLREEVLPAFVRLGDVRSHAVTLGKIAAALAQRGELEESLQIRREELPVYERLGDVRSRAVALKEIADALAQRGELEESLRILREDVLPTFERLGGKRDLLVGRATLALLLLKRAGHGDREEARDLLLLALQAAEELRIPEAGLISAILSKHGLDPPKEDGP